MQIEAVHGEMAGVDGAAGAVETAAVVGKKAAGDNRRDRLDPSPGLARPLKSLVTTTGQYYKQPVP